MAIVYAYRAIDPYRYIGRAYDPRRPRARKRWDHPLPFSL